MFIKFLTEPIGQYWHNLEMVFCPLKLKRGDTHKFPLNLDYVYSVMKIKLKTSVIFCSNVISTEHIRDVYYQGFREHCNNFDVMNHTEKLNYLMSADVVKTTEEFIYKCYCKRREFIYK